MLMTTEKAKKKVTSAECEEIGLVRQPGRGTAPNTLDSDENGQFIVALDRSRYAIPQHLFGRERTEMRHKVAALIRKHDIKILDHIDDLSM